MDNKTAAKKNTLQVRAGPLGYLYARNRLFLGQDVISLLSAKSADRDTAVIPLLKGVTVEKEFVTNVAAVSGTRTTGLGGAGTATAKLLSTHYAPYAFAFFGAETVRPSSSAPNLSSACDAARARFGFAPYAPPCPGAEETSGRQICEALNLDPEETALYLVVTQAFREAVYLCNSFIFYGGAERVTIRSDGGAWTSGGAGKTASSPARARRDSDADGGGSSDSPRSGGRGDDDEGDEGSAGDDGGGGRSARILGLTEAVRVPLYPVHLAMPDFNRVNGEPFNPKHRSIGDGCVLPKAFFNDDLCRLIHGYVLGPACVALRVRNADAVARGAAHLCFDENHESVVLPNDVTFCLLESERAACADGGQDVGSGNGGGAGNGSGSSSSSSGGAGRNGGNGAVFAAGLARRTASLMSADAALAVENLMSTAVHEETATDPDEWPLLADAADEQDATARLGAYMARVAGLVGAMIFAPNSAVYMTDVEDSFGPWGPADTVKLSDDQAFNRFFQVACPHAADATLVDRDGRRAPQPASAKPRDATTAKSNGGGVKTGGPQSSRATHEFQLDFLCMACGFCPQLLAKMLFYLERVDVGAAAYRFDSDALRYAASAVDSDVSCDLCGRYEKHLCARTLMHRLRHRLPRFGGALYNGAVGLFGAITSNYCDADPLGDYAAFTKLKRLDGEENRSVIQDTYRVAAERVLAELESAGLLRRDDPGDPASADAFVRDPASFVSAFSLVKSLAEREALQLMQTLVKTRDFRPSEGLAEANHVLFLAAEPYAAGFCPLLSFLHRRSLLTVVQDAALSQCHSVMEDHQVEARNFRTQFQTVLRKRVLGLYNMGFFCTRPATVTLAEPAICIPDPTLDQFAPAVPDADGDLVRVNVEVIKQLKVKSRLTFSGGNPASTDQAARNRLSGMIEAYQRPDRRVDVLAGALGFALKRYHISLFSEHKPSPAACAPPPGSSGPLHAPRVTRDSGAAAAAQWFWTKLQKNQMPAKRLKKEDVDLISFVKRYTDEYAAGNFINVTPTCVGDLAHFTFANAVLRLCDHKSFFITAVTGLVAQAKRPRDPAAVLPWIAGEVTSGADMEAAARALIDTVDTRPTVWTSAFAATNMMRHATGEKPMIVLGVRISKYVGSSGNNRACQTGNWGALMGGKNACPLMPFDRTRRYAIVCPRIGFVARREGGYFSAAAKEKTLVDRVRVILAEGGSAPHAAVYLTAVKTLGLRVRDMDEDDWTSLVDDPYMAASLAEINRAAEASPEGWTLQSAERAAKEAADAVTAASSTDGGEATFDFGACAESPAAAGAGHEDAVGSSASSLCAAPAVSFYGGNCEVAIPAGGPAGASKRPFVADPLFDIDLPPEPKRPALTVDML